MKIADRSFPYPVLSPARDDVSPSRFELNCACRSDAKSYYVSYKLDQNNSTLNHAITQGEAEYAIHVEGRDCFYRVLHRSGNAAGNIEIPADNITGTVEITGFVVARQPLPAYKIAGSHADYGDGSFSVRRGDVLAYSRTFTFEAEKDLDPLKKLSSIVQILPGEDTDGPFSVDFEGGKLSILLSKNAYQLYGQAKHDPNIASTLIQGIVFPVLVAGVQTAAVRRNAGETLPKWAEIVRQRLSVMQIDLELGIDNPLRLAQALLQDPTHRFLSEMMKITEGEGDDAKISH